jgi:hypothetical protein
MPSRLQLVVGCSLAVLTLGAACSDGGDEAPPPAGPQPLVFTATLSAANERPNPATSSATGTARVVVTGSSATYTVTVNGLTGAPRLSHIHAPADASTNASVMVNFDPSAVTTGSGTFSGSFSAADIVGQGGNPPIAFDSLVTLLRNGRAYVNVHTAQFGAGEIRGQLTGP